MELNDVTLMRLDEDRIVTIDGAKYIVITNPKTKAHSKSKAKGQSFNTEEAIKPVLVLLNENPEGMKAGEIRRKLESRFGLTPSYDIFRRMMTKMRDDGQVRVDGTKNAAVWYANTPDRQPMQAVV